MIEEMYAFFVEGDFLSSPEFLFQSSPTHFRKVDGVAVSLPAPLVELRYLTVPVVHEKDVPSLIGYEMAKTLQYRLEEAVIDYTISGTMEDSLVQKNRIIGFACRKSEVQAILDPFQKHHLPVQVVDVVPTALLTLYKALVPEFVNQDIAGIDIGDQYAHILLVKQGRLVFTRSFPLHIQKYQRDSIQALQDELVVEFAHSIEYCQRRIEPVQVQQIFLSGGSPEMVPLRDRLAAQLELHCQWLHPFSLAQITNQNGNPVEFYSRYSVATGLALRLVTEST